MTHTEASLLGIVVTIVLDLWVLRTRLLTRRAFWVSYAIVLFFQLVTNEWLTSQGVFIYDPAAILEVRIGHAPLEDFFFGFALVTQSMMWWVWWGRRGVQVDGADARASRPRGGARPSAADGGATPRPGG